MAPRDNWSDSDDEDLSDEETSVHLGIPDGPLESASDALDPAVSRIGGRPAFLASINPPFSSSCCKNCSSPMELLVQLWCPLENSPNDRALYIWGCARGGCQKKDGSGADSGRFVSVRAWRGLRFNQKYAAKLEKKRAHRNRVDEEKFKLVEAAKKAKEAGKINPFSLKGSAPSGLSGLGAQIFGSDSVDDDDNDGDEEKQTIDDVEGDESDDGQADEETLVTALAGVSLVDSAWSSGPEYLPLYISTTSEYLPPPPKSKVAVPDEDAVGEGGKSKDGGWALEGYENSLEVDNVFERFSRRVGYQSDQCIRYELGGSPLPFASDKVLEGLYPVPKQTLIPITKGDFMVQPSAHKRTYDPSSLPPCPVCKSRRVFECQLMPNLINVLQVPGAGLRVKKKQSDEERRKEVEQILRESKGGMEWGTSMVFSCEKDCCVEGGQSVQNCWREEVVLVQWDV